MSDQADNTRDGMTAGQDVPLVRTEGRGYNNGALWSPSLILRDPHLRREHRNQIAREAEVAFGLGESLYFYVGHACPDFARDGNAFVFVFAAETFDGAPGTMTHFDTGGLYCKKIHLDREVDLKQYVAAHRLDTLAGWQARFRAYVGEYFSSAKAYVLGEKPTKKDDYGRLRHPRNERRAWTWELQLHDDHPIHRGLRWLWLTIDAYDRLTTEIANLSDEAQKKHWQELFDEHVPLPPVAINESTSLCRLAEEEIARWL